jgi:anti-sigma factor RsiW
MDWDRQLKVQALVDGELAESEAREVTQWLERDAEAAALLTELRQTRAALAGIEADLRLPESREFFWSKIQREIQRLDKPAATPVRAGLLARLHRFLVPTAAVALLVMAGLLAVRHGDWPVVSGGSERETALADTGAFTYRDYAAGTTLVWLSYPADNDSAAEDDSGTL